MGRQRRLLARAATLVALTAAFAATTAVFNSTYKQQAEVDARLTNGADVTVTESPGTNVGPAEGAALSKVKGVSSVEPLQHRYAYVGADLQDLYGVRPATVGAAGKLQDAWFQGGSAKQLMGTLARRPDSVLVSAETVKDFQLHPGRRDSPAPAERRHQEVRERPVPLRGRRQGVPHGPHRLVPGREL